MTRTLEFDTRTRAYYAAVVEGLGNPFGKRAKIGVQMAGNKAARAMVVWGRTRGRRALK